MLAEDACETLIPREGNRLVRRAMMQLIWYGDPSRFFDGRRRHDAGLWRANAAAGVRGHLHVVRKLGEPGDLQVGAQAMPVGRDAIVVDVRKAAKQLARPMRAQNVRTRRTGFG